MRISDWSSDVCSSDLLLARRFAQQRDRKAPADMRRVEQRAIGAVVDIKLFAAALFDPDDQRAVFGGQRAAGLAPQLGRIADRQAFEAAVDGVEIGVERRRLHAWVGGRKAAADIDDEIGRESCMGRVCQYLLITVVYVALNTQLRHQITLHSRKQ